MMKLSLSEAKELLMWTNGRGKLKLSGVIRGGADIEIQGSKNAAQKLVPIAALVPGVYTLNRLPSIADTFAVLEIIEFLGGEVQYENSEWILDTRSLENRPILRSMTVKSTGTFQFVGALLGRFGSAHVAAPGGDKIGGRPVDYHLDALNVLGVASESKHEFGYQFETDGLRGGHVKLPIPSAGAFMNVLIAACRATGASRIENVPWDHDTQAACMMLRGMGASIEMSQVEGVTSVDVTPIPDKGEPLALRTAAPADRNDAATWLVAAALSAEGMTLHGADFDELRPLIDFLRRVGCSIKSIDSDRIAVVPGGRLDADGVHVVAGHSPRLHSDWAQLASVVLAVGYGKSSLLDTMYESRYTQVDDLNKMGADIKVVETSVERGSLMYDSAAESAQMLTFSGGVTLRGAEVCGNDVRGTMALVLAGSRASGDTVIVKGIDQLSRGYEHLPDRLRSLGLHVELVS